MSIHFWLCWVFVAAQDFLRLQPVGATLWLRCAGFPSLWLLLLLSTGSRVCRLAGTVAGRLSGWGPRALSTGSVLVTDGLSCSASQIRGPTTSPALAGRFFTTELPGKPSNCYLDMSSQLKNRGSVINRTFCILNNIKKLKCIEKN